MRFDQWLWAVRVFKTRPLAVAAIKAGRAKINGANAKPAHEMRASEIVTVRLSVMTRTLRVIGAPTSRVAAKLVPQFFEELTSPEEFEKQREFALGMIGARAKGAGRPTKRERRALDEEIS